MTWQFILQGVMVMTGNPEEKKTWVMYPVPVRDLLTLQYRGLGTDQGGHQRADTDQHRKNNYE